MKSFRNSFVAICLLGITCGALAKIPVTVIGSGYVGLITAAGIAEKCGQRVIAADVDPEKISMLKLGRMPIFEDGLEELAHKHIASHKLKFTTDLGSSIRKSDVIFIAVGTPMSETGAADLSAVYSVARTIGENLNTYKVVIVKSTVPVGTGAQVQALIEESSGRNDLCDVVSNPEFLSQGTAVKDFMNPDRIVVGSDSPRALALVRELYSPLINAGVPLIETSRITSETIKYASNSFLALKLSFINEMARFADATGADVGMIAQGMGLDPRIGKHFLAAGPGFGGSCFPKDCNALLHIGEEFGVSFKTIKAALDVNVEQRDYVLKKLETLLEGQLEGKTIAMLGLAFKANTDDVRESPALDMIGLLRDKGANVRAYDPLATRNALKIIPDLSVVSSVMDAAMGADAVIVMTEWPEFKNVDLQELYGNLKGKVVLDARNMFDACELKRIGFKSDAIGRNRHCI